MDNRMADGRPHDDKKMLHRGRSQGSQLFGPEFFRRKRVMDAVSAFGNVVIALAQHR